MNVSFATCFGLKKNIFRTEHLGDEVSGEGCVCIMSEMLAFGQWRNQRCLEWEPVI